MPRGVPKDPGTRCRMIKADGSRCGLTAAKSKKADGYCYQHMGAQRRRTWGAIKRVRSGYHATDDSSLPSAGRGMTRMHNLCAQRQRAIDMRVSHIAPGGLRPSAMHEPREISKQTNNHSASIRRGGRRAWMANAPVTRKNGVCEDAIPALDRSSRSGSLQHPCGCIRRPEPDRFRWARAGIEHGAFPDITLLRQ